MCARVGQAPSLAKYATASEASLKALLTPRGAEETKEEGPVSDMVTLDMRFDPAQLVNCVLEEGETQFRSSGTGYVLGREPLTAGKATWEFTDIQDSPNDETSCYGAATLPITGPKYDNSSFYVLRSYNGKLYKVSVPVLAYACVMLLTDNWRPPW